MIPFSLAELENIISLEFNFQNRYVAPQKLINFLKKKYKNFIKEIGRSTLDQPILMIQIGTGKKNAILWTQMHGNETTGTLSCLDILKFLSEKNEIAKTILANFTLDIVFMLNPDGGEIWTRRNIQGIDINRDFLAEASIEIRVLKNMFKSKKYNLAFNLHDQRTIFGVGNKKEPATLAFLAPSESEDRIVTETRKKAMGLIADLYQELSFILPNKISRFSDEFYPRSIGDNLQKQGLPTILFEGGHYPNDYHRQQTRKYFTLSLIQVLYNSSVKENWSHNYENYFLIPENSTSFYDVIFRNVKLSDDHKNNVDIAIQFVEIINQGDEEISFMGKIEDIGDLSFMNGHQEIDAEGRCFYSREVLYPKIGMIADFKLDEWQIINGKRLHNFS